MNAYQNFLLNLSEKVPVIDTLGFIQSDGLYADSGEMLDAFEPGRTAGIRDAAVCAFIQGRTRTLRCFLTESGTSPGQWGEAIKSWKKLRNDAIIRHVPKKVD